MDFKSVAILGAGAVGCYVLWGLSQKNDIDLCVIADGSRKERFEKDGFNINDVVYRPKIKTPQEAYGVDLLVVAVKYNSLRDSLKDIKEIVGENTTVMSLMNGVDSEEVISEVVNESQILYSLIKVASERDENNIKFVPENTIGVILGERDGSDFGTQRTDAFSRLCDGTGLRYRVTDIILCEIWAKFRLNISNNLPQAMLGCGVGIYEDSEYAAEIQRKLRAEVEAVAKAKGINISAVPILSAKGAKVAPRARYSTLQDLDAKRHTEIDMFSGALVKMGKEVGVPTPYNELTYNIIKALEEKNDGKFNYV